MTRLRRHTDLPIGVGFGIRTPESARAVSTIADAAAVGSAIVDRIAAGLAENGRAAPNLAARVLEYVSELAAGVRGGGGALGRVLAGDRPAAVQLFADCLRRAAPRRDLATDSDAVRRLCAQLDGLLEMAEQIFDAGVRYGLPRGLGGLVDVIGSPAWATATGLLLYGKAAEEAQGRHKRRAGWSVRHVVGSLKGMFQDLL